MSPQWNQQLFRYALVIKYLGKSNTQMNTECSKQIDHKKPSTQQMNKVWTESMEIKVWKYQSVKCSET